MMLAVQADGSFEENEERLCVICLVNERDTTVLPCRHLCMCHDCAQVPPSHNLLVLCSLQSSFRKGGRKDILFLCTIVSHLSPAKSVKHSQGTAARGDGGYVYVLLVRGPVQSSQCHWLW